jgi:hypothetical protein
MVRLSVVAATVDAADDQRFATGVPNFGNR